MFDANLFNQVERILIAFIPMLCGMVLHELAHGWVAYRQGDPTAKAQGRLTLNPIRHLDPMGSLVFVLTSLSGSFIIGWAKPVPVNPRWFHSPRRGMMLVSAAGPATNFALAVVFAFLYRVLLDAVPPVGGVSPVMEFLLRMCSTGIWINVMLAWFNLMPVPPLDGSRIVAGLLPPKLAWQYESVGRYGLVIVVILLASGLLGKVVWPLVEGTVTIIASLLGLS